MTPSRRDFLNASAGTAGLALTGSFGAGQDPPKDTARIRKDIATLNANSPDIVSLSKAVTVMKDPMAKVKMCETWANWTAIHGTVGGSFNKCQHNNWFIWPWHRMYVYFFEQIVSQLSGDPKFALPYWNWSKNPTIPALFWQAPLLDTTRVVTQGQAIDSTQFNQFVSPTVITNILNIASFGTFAGTAGAGGELEGTPHNFIHNWINGDMASAGSPTDPIFWMHHCNCDRLYSAWIGKHPNGLPTDAAWLNHEFKDFCGMGLKVSQTVKTEDLKYTYDKLTPTVVMAAVTAPAAMVGIEGPITKERKTVGPAVTFALSPKDKVATAIQKSAAGAVDPRAMNISLLLQGIKVPANQNVRVSVFINAPNASPVLPVTDPHYVTSFTFFQGQHAEKDDHKEKKDGHDDVTTSRLVDATHTLNRLFGASGFTGDETLTVQIVAAPLFPERGDQWAGTVQQLSPSQVQIIAASPKE
jgi:tyrosinase